MLTFVVKNIIAICIFFVGAVLGSLTTYFYVVDKTSMYATDIAVRQGGYNFINPLLSCNISEDTEFSEYKPIKNKFLSYINQHISVGDAKDISVYFRSLDSGRWSGVNENDVYSPASLLKVPLMIAWLKDVDKDKSILDKRIAYHQKTDQNKLESYKPEKFIEDGSAYSVDELIRYMIMYSDNNAMQLLQDNVNQNTLSNVYYDLGIPASDSLTNDVVSPKVYAYVFRILYNATYLSKPMSQYALELLIPADFPGGIKTGVPATTPSAQKFGERSVFIKNVNTGDVSLDYRELHDCGIVYYPKNPYLLCVMTKGDDFSKLNKIITDISAIVYNETDKGVLKK